VIGFGCAGTTSGAARAGSDGGADFRPGQPRRGRPTPTHSRGPLVRQRAQGGSRCGVPARERRSREHRGRVGVLHHAGGQHGWPTRLW